MFVLVASRSKMVANLMILMEIDLLPNDPDFRPENRPATADLPPNGSKSFGPTRCGSKSFYPHAVASRLPLLPHAFLVLERLRGELIVLVPVSLLDLHWHHLGEPTAPCGVKKVEERIESYWASLPRDVQTKVRLKSHLYRDMYMAAHGRGSMIAEMRDLDSTLVNFPRQIKIRE